MRHERHLRSIYDDEKSFFKELLEKDSSISIHDRNLRALAIEMYKIYYEMAPTIMDEIFTLKNRDQYNVGDQTDFDISKVRSVNHGSESVRYLGAMIQETIPTDIKELYTNNKFDMAIKNGKQNLFHVDYVKSICKIQARQRLNHTFVALFVHIL